MARREGDAIQRYLARPANRRDRIVAELVGETAETGSNYVPPIVSTYRRAGISASSSIQAFFFRGLMRQFGLCLRPYGRPQKMENVLKETDECRKDKVAKLQALRQFYRRHGRSQREKLRRREDFVPGTN